MLTSRKVSYEHAPSPERGGLSGGVALAEGLAQGREVQVGGVGRLHPLPHYGHEQAPQLNAKQLARLLVLLIQHVGDVRYHALLHKKGHAMSVSQ